MPLQVSSQNIEGARNQDDMHDHVLNYDQLNKTSKVSLNHKYENSLAIRVIIRTD